MSQEEKPATENKSPKQQNANVQRTNEQMARPDDVQGPTDALPYDGKSVKTVDDRSRR